MSDLSADPIDEINAMQKRIIAGEDISAEDMAKVITQLRSQRSTIQESATEKKKTRSAGLPKVDIASLFAPKKKGE